MGGPGAGREAAAALGALPIGRSAELFDRAQEVLVGGVNSPVRAMRAIGRDPLFIARAEGPHVWDADGARYVDFLSSWGPAILGHAPAVPRAGRCPAPGHVLRRPHRARGALRRGRDRRVPVGRAAAHDLLGERGRDGGGAAGARGHRARAGREGRRRLPRRDRRPPRRGRQRPHHPRRALQPGRDRGRHRRDPHRRVQRRRGRRGGARGAAAMLVEPVAGNMGVVPPDGGYLPALRRPATAPGPPDPGRGHHRLPGRPRRGAATR